MTNFALTTGVNSFAGGSGNDFFSGPGGGQDSLSGGLGNDQWTIDRNQIGTIDGGAGVDRITLDPGSFNNQLNSSLVIEGVEILVATTTNLYASIAQLSGIEAIEPAAGGSDFYLFLQGDGGEIGFSGRFNQSLGLHVEADGVTSSVRLVGTPHADTLMASHFNDVIYGDVGNDSLDGSSGDDTLNGAVGDDTLVGGSGNDTFLVNSAGDRVLEGASGHGLAGNVQGVDTVYASTSYALQTGQSIEWLATTQATGTIALNLSGNDLAQTLAGNNGVNGLVGGGGHDTLYGLGGNDRLIGGGDRDVLYGGTGNDTFVDYAVSETTGFRRDLVMGPSLDDGDRFQLTVKPLMIDTSVTNGALNVAQFDANLAAAVTAERLAAHHAVLFDPNGGDLNTPGHTFLVVDANGVAGYQGGQDYVIELYQAVGTLTADDFA